MLAPLLESDDTKTCTVAIRRVLKRFDRSIKLWEQFSVDQKQFYIDIVEMLKPVLGELRDRLKRDSWVDFEREIYALYRKLEDV